MKDRKELWQNIISSENMAAIPGFQQPLVEICGDSRVLIENHRGVFEYSTTNIGIRVTFGFLHVCGNNLCLKHMAKERLVICGCIESVSISRRIANDTD